MHNDSEHFRATSSPVTKALAGLLALAVAMGIGRFAFTPVLPMMLKDTGLTIAGGAMLASANYLGYLIGALAATALRLAPEKAIRGGLLAIGITTLTMGLPLSFNAWLLLRLLSGIASAWVLISVSAWCLESFAAYRRPVLNSVVFAGVGSGIAAAGLLCIALIRMHTGSSRAWVLLGVLSLVVTAMVWTCFKPVATTDADVSHSERHGARWHAGSIRLILCYGIFGFGYIIPATFLPVMAKKALHSAALFGWSWPIFGLAAALSTLIASPLIQRLGNRRLWRACHLVMAAGVALPAIWDHALAVFAAALCGGGTFMVITLAALQEAKHVAGKDASVLIAAMTSAFAAGQIAGPMSITLGLDGNGSFSPALLLAAFLLTASTFLLRSGGRRIISTTAEQ